MILQSVGKDYQDAEKILVDTDPAVVPVYQNGGAMMNKQVCNRH